MTAKQVNCYSHNFGESMHTASKESNGAMHPIISMSEK